MHVIMLAIGLWFFWFGVLFWLELSFVEISANGLIVVDLLMIALVVIGIYFMCQRITVNKSDGHWYVIWCSPGRVEAIALACYIGGGVSAILSLVTVVWDERIWIAIARIVPYTPLGLPLWVNVFFSSVIISALGLIVSIIMDLRKSRDLEQQVQAVIQRLT